MKQVAPLLSPGRPTRTANIHLDGTSNEVYDWLFARTDMDDNLLRVLIELMFKVFRGVAHVRAVGILIED